MVSTKISFELATCIVYAFKHSCHLHLFHFRYRNDISAAESSWIDFLSCSSQPYRSMTVMSCRHWTQFVRVTTNKQPERNRAIFIIIWHIIYIYIYIYIYIHFDVFLPHLNISRYSMEYSYIWIVYSNHEKSQMPEEE